MEIGDSYMEISRMIPPASRKQMVEGGLNHYNRAVVAAKTMHTIISPENACRVFISRALAVEALEGASIHE